MGQKADHREQIYRRNEEDTWARRGSAAEEVQQRKCSRGEADEVAEEVQQRRGRRGSRGGTAGERKEERRRRRTAYLNHKTTHRGSGKIKSM